MGRERFYGDSGKSHFTMNFNILRLYSIRRFLQPVTDAAIAQFLIAIRIIYLCMCSVSHLYYGNTVLLLLYIGSILLNVWKYCHPLPQSDAQVCDKIGQDIRRQPLNFLWQCQTGGLGPSRQALFSFFFSLVSQPKCPREIVLQREEGKKNKCNFAHFIFEIAPYCDAEGYI